MSKTQTGWIWLGIGLAGAYLGWSNRRLLTVHDITTGESAAYPALRSRVYYTDIDAALTATERVLEHLAGWQLQSKDSGNAILEATAGSSFGLWTDDVTVYFFALGHGQTRVTIRARSRTEYGDIGRNAAHIRALQSALDDQLTAGAAF